MNNLKPCPFCGGKARLEQMGYPHHVYCTVCHAKVTGQGIAMEGEVDAIMRWNKRTNESVEPKHYPSTRYNGELFACGDCKHELSEKQQRFCPFCGKEVNWHGC